VLGGSSDSMPTDFGVGPPLTAAKGGFLIHLGN
jgi:hypothetical protein